MSVLLTPWLLESPLAQLVKELDLCLFYPPKSGILWIMHGHRMRLQRFLVFSLQAIFLLGFIYKWLVMAEIWLPYSFSSPGVTIMLWGVKNMKNYDYACVQAI